ncbi:MAG TPA: CRISPR-associated endonuclease Cas2 [Mesotoga infera]|uniref:CRISPR-associated endoribonuclease Cas2 n=1 Tax=Mesotoga infera TaxID=1236046 RepID=A0A7C1CUV8_9BACT|nr:CRISPR-associated endonuclease Cas2 [Mesotoga infera]
MWVIIVYDINEKRVAKVLKYLRRFLNWIQNSVFEGELTFAELKKVKSGLKKLMKTEEDSVIIFSSSLSNDYKKEIIGLDKAKETQIL